MDLDQLVQSGFASQRKKGEAHDDESLSDSSSGLELQAKQREG